MNEKNFIVIELKNWQQFFKNKNNFLMQNPINETYVLFEIVNEKENKPVKNFNYSDIKELF